MGREVFVLDLGTDNFVPDLSTVEALVTTKALNTDDSVYEELFSNVTDEVESDSWLSEEEKEKMIMDEYNKRSSEYRFLEEHLSLSPTVKEKLAHAFGNGMIVDSFCKGNEYTLIIDNE